MSCDESPSCPVPPFPPSACLGRSLPGGTTKRQGNKHFCFQEQLRKEVQGQLLLSLLPGASPEVPMECWGLGSGPPSGKLGVLAGAPLKPGVLLGAGALWQPSPEVGLGVDPKGPRV